MTTEYEWIGLGRHYIGGAATERDLTSLVRVRDGSFALRTYDVRTGGSIVQLSQSPISYREAAICLMPHDPGLALDVAARRSDH